MNNKKLLLIQIVSYFVSSIALVLASFASYEDTATKKAFSIVVGLLFWIGLVVGIVMAIVLKKKNGKEIEKTKAIGLIRFFKNKLAVCFDIAMLISFVASVIVVATKMEAFIGSVLIGLFIFTFEMHCVLNGKIFEYIKNGGKNND